MCSMPLNAEWDSLVRPSPFRLRFELGGEAFGNDAPVPRFVQAFDRARKISQGAFEASEKIWGIVASWPGSINELFAPAQDGMAALREAGFSGHALAQWTAPLGPWDDDGPPATWYAFDLTNDLASRNCLIWCSVSSEMAVTPQAPIRSHLIDPDRQILVHVYDDRGMDVTALKRGALSKLYEDRSEWLLDYDRDRMRLAFDGPHRDD